MSRSIFKEWLESKYNNKIHFPLQYILCATTLWSSSKTSKTLDQKINHIFSGNKESAREEKDVKSVIWMEILPYAKEKDKTNTWEKRTTVLLIYQYLRALLQRI